MSYLIKNFNIFQVNGPADNKSSLGDMQEVIVIKQRITFS